MKHYTRIGEPTQLNWSLYGLDNNEFSLEGLFCKLYYITGRGRTLATGVVHQDNILSWTFTPSMQWATGFYSLLLEVYNSNEKIISIDYADAFYLGENIPTNNEQQSSSASELRTIDIKSVHDVYKLTPVVPVVGSDGYWYVNGVRVVDGDGQPVPASHTLTYDSQTNYLIIDAGRVDKDGQSIEVVITDIASALINYGQAYREAEQARDEAYATAEGARDREFSSAEGTRASAEDARKTAETDRALAEGQGDYSDPALYPNTRRAKEAARQTAEANRVKNEGSDGPDSEGYSTSRIKMEIDRQSAETQRQTNEGIGATDAECAAGSRRKNESIRQANEETRQSQEETRQAQEGTPSDEASASGSRWARYKYAEAARQTSYETDEGKASDAASATGSRWARYNKAEADRETAYDTAEASRTAGMAPLAGYYGCSTAASTAAKEVAATNYVLTNGGSIKVKFTYANSASSPTLNINSTGAKAIVYNGAAASASNTWAAGDVVEFYYDPTYNSNAGAFVGVPTVVAVSQNASTGHADIEIGGDSYPVASLKDLRDVKGYNRDVVEVPATSGTYISHYIPFDFINGVTYKWGIVYPDGYSGYTYMSVRGENGDPSVLQNDIGRGNASRENSFTCSVEGGRTWNVTIEAAHESDLEFIIWVGDTESLSLFMLNDDGSVTTNKIATGAVTAAKLASNSVTNAKVEDNAITSAKLDSQSIVRSSKSIILDSERAFAYEADSTGVYITTFTFVVRGSANVNIWNLAGLLSALGMSSYDSAPSGADSIKVANGKNLVLRFQTLSIVSNDNVTIGDRIIISVLAGQIQAGEYAPVTTKQIADSGVTEQKIADSGVTEQKIADLAVTERKVSQDFYKKTVGLFSNTFIFPATEGTYITNYYNVPFINGHRYRLTIKNPSGYTGRTYFSVRGYNGSTSIYQNGLLDGTTSREGEFTCEIDGGLSWCLTVANAHDSELRFECTMIDLDIDSVGNNCLIIDNIIGKKNIIQLNGKAYLDNIMAQSKRAARYMDGGTAGVGESQLVLLHFSDIHGDADNVKRILEFKEEYPALIDDIICSGDMVTDKWEDDYDWWTSVGASKIMTCIGNHDVQTTGTAITSLQAYNRYIAPFVSSWGVTQPANASTLGLNYYYKDYATSKIRVVVLDCMFGTTDEKTWLQGVLADTLDSNSSAYGYAVICVQHYPFGAQTALDTPFNSLMPRVAPMSNAIFNDAVKDFVDAGGEFICWLVGHEHSDYIGTIQEFPEQLVITIANGGGNDYWDDTARVKGEKSQDCFNIISFDYYQKMIKIARIGADYDRLLRHKGTLCYDYANKELIFTS